jgi:hypothetical protein
MNTCISVQTHLFIFILHLFYLSRKLHWFYKLLLYTVTNWDSGEVHRPFPQYCTEYTWTSYFKTLHQYRVYPAENPIWAGNCIDFINCCYILSLTEIQLFWYPVTCYLLSFRNLGVHFILTEIIQRGNQGNTT